MANFENITIEKGMYQTKGGLTEALEKLDPSENYIGSSAMISASAAEAATAWRSSSRHPTPRRFFPSM